MARNFDTTRARRDIEGLTELLEYVLEAHPHGESDWLEWKTSLDLSTPRDKFAVAKQILGFANRHPDKASGYGGGCGYFLLGLEPGNLVGQTPIDPADLDSGIRGYVGTGTVQWTPVWIPMKSAVCLAIVVEPPSWGDDIHTLQKGYDNFSAGQIFVRRAGGTHTASPAEVRLLQQRATRRGVEPPLVEVLDVGGEISAVDLAPERIADWVDRERRWLLEPLEASRAPTAGVTLPLSEAEARGYVSPQVAKAAREALRAAEQVRKSPAYKAFFDSEPESRSEDEYLEQVESYLARATTALPDVAKEALARTGSAKWSLEVRNPTDRNFPGLQVEVVIPGRVVAHQFSLDAGLPTRPRRWGPVSKRLPAISLLAGVLSNSLPNEYPPSYSSEASYEVECGDGLLRIIFDPVDLRPRATVRLPIADLIVDMMHAGSIVPCRWSATSTAVDGISEGVVDLRIGHSCLSPSLLIPGPEESGDGI